MVEFERELSHRQTNLELYQAVTILTSWYILYQSVAQVKYFVRLDSPLLCIFRRADCYAHEQGVVNPWCHSISLLAHRRHCNEGLTHDVKAMKTIECQHSPRLASGTQPSCAAAHSRAAADDVKAVKKILAATAGTHLAAPAWKFVRHVIELAGHMMCDDFFYVVQLENQGDFCMADQVVRQMRMWHLSLHHDK